MIYTIQANDDLLGREKIKRVLQKNRIVIDTMNTMEFDINSTNMNDIISYCNTSPFFAEYKIAIMKNPIFLTSDGGKEYDEAVESLMAYINNENSTSVLIIYSLYEKLDERKKILKFLKEKTEFIKVETPNHVEINKLIKTLVAKHNLSIDNDAVNLLLEKVGNNMVDLVNEIDKLTTFKVSGNISKNDLDDFIVCSVDANIFDLSDAILKRKVSLALDRFDELNNSGLEPIVLVSIMANQFRLALLSKAFLKKGLNQGEIARKLKVHPYRIKLALNLNYKDNKIKEVLVALANLDYNIKIGKVNKYQGLKLLILSV